MKHSVEQVELPSGALGLLVDVPDAAVMSYDFNFRAGDYLSPLDKWDTAHIMEHMVLGANKRYHKPSNYFKEFSKNGAYCNASTGTYHMGYEAECADFEAERILDLLCLAIEAPLFLKSVFEAEKSNVKEELRGLSNSHFSSLSLNLGEAMGLCEINFAHREKLLKNIQLDDIKKHYKNTHTMSNLRFIIAGQVQKYRTQIIKRVNQMDLARGDGRIALNLEIPKGLSRPLLIKNPTVNNIYYRWETFLDDVLDNEQEYASSALFGTLLGTLHSRIFGVAREHGLVYGINFGKYRTKTNHLWWIGGQVLPDNIDALFSLFAKELRAVADGDFTQREMKEAKQYALGTFHRSVQTVGQLLGGYYTRFAFDDEVEEYDKVPDYIAAVTRQQVIKMAQFSLSQDNLWGLGFYGAVDKINHEVLHKKLAAIYK